MKTHNTREVEEFSKKWHELGIPNGCLVHMREYHHQQLQKAREEERERCIQAIKNPLTDWECIADLEDGDAHNHKTITVCRAVASINNIFKE